MTRCCYYTNDIVNALEVYKLHLSIVLVKNINVYGIKKPIWNSSVLDLQNITFFKLGELCQKQYNYCINCVFYNKILDLSYNYCYNSLITIILSFDDDIAAYKILSL